jgi:predicted ArsR family transcriptional regulator
VKGKGDPPTDPGADRIIGDAQRRIVDHLKRSSPCKTADLAEALGISGAAVRPQLAELEDKGLVQQELQPTSGRGRPPSAWSLTPLAIDLFPDRHRDLTVELLEAVRTAVGEEGLEAVLAARDRAQLEVLGEALGDRSDLRERTEVLAAHRTRQGYMAEVVDDGDALLLVEHHCPVCAAAESCQSLCRNELDLFRDALGPTAEVERTQHLLSGDDRCVYRIRPRA